MTFHLLSTQLHYPDSIVESNKMGFSDEVRIGVSPLERIKR